MNKLKEAATTKNAIRGALRFVDEALNDKTIPQTMRDALGHLRDSLKKSWADMTPSAKPAKTEESKRLSESATVATGIEARIDDAANDIFNGLYGYGQVTREEWLCLDDCFDVGRDAFVAKLLADCPALFGRGVWDVPEEADPASVETEMAASTDDYTPQMGKESATIELTSDVIMLNEAGTATGGAVPIKIIQPGWGSSGYYSKEVLQRDGPKAFPAGTHMYMDHPTAQEEAARPERSLKDLAAVTMKDAEWLDAGPAGPGLYTEARPFSDAAGKLKEMAPHIGVSIRASGQAENGEMEGRKGPLIKAITNGKSVDFVTAAGAGGKILAEAARGNPAAPVTQSTEVNVEKEIQERLEKLETENARLREGALLREAKDFVTATLPASIPALTRARLVESLSKNPPVKDGTLDTAAYEKAITEASKAEMEYLARATGAGAIRGMGSSSVAEPDAAKIEEALVATFVGMGMSESTAKLAARGRN